MDAILQWMVYGYRLGFFCKRRIQKFFMTEETQALRRVPITKLPWLWLGAELRNGKIVTVTDQVNKEVQMGDKVTNYYLEHLTGIYPVYRWLYLDPVTLNEQEIPLEGLTIE